MSGKFRALSIAGLLVTLTLGSAVAASATPIMTGTVTVTEHEPPFTDTVDTVTIGPGQEIKFNDGTNIGDNLLLSGEYIDIGDSSLKFNIYGGAGADPSNPGFSFTNYTSPAEYIFSDINFDTPGRITGVSYVDNGTVKNFSGLDLSFTDNSITVHVGGLTVKNPPLFGLLDLDVTTEALTAPPIPEPGTMSLLGLGILAGWRARRRLRSN